MRTLMSFGLILIAGCGFSTSMAPMRASSLPVSNEVVNPSDSTQKPEQNKATDASPANQKKSTEPVVATIRVPNSTIHPGDTFELIIELKIASGYEIHSYDASPPMIPTRLDLELPTGFQAITDWKVPDSMSSLGPDGHSVYVGSATFRREIRVEEGIQPGNYECKVIVNFQACTERFCLRPESLSVNQNITVK